MTSSARPRTTVDMVQPQQLDDLLQEVRTPQQRLQQRDLQIRAGPAPAGCRAARRPSPRRTTETPSGTTSESTAQFSRCRSHSRGTSRGPISPRVTPASASSSRVPHGVREALAEYLLRRLRRRRELRCCLRHGEPSFLWTASPAGNPGQAPGITQNADNFRPRLRADGAEETGALSGQAGSTTTRRCGSSPSDSLRSPAAATASWTTLRSKGVIGSQLHRLAGALGLLGRLRAELRELRALTRPEAGDVQHQTAAVTGLPVHGQPGQLLQRLQHLTVAARPASAGRGWSSR